MDGHYFEIGLADALGSVRAEIAALKEREAQLRVAILASPRRETGREFDVVIRRSTSRRLNRAALPEAILSNPRYWIETATTTVLTRTRDTAPALKGERIVRPSRTGMREEAVDVDVIEDM